MKVCSKFPPSFFPLNETFIWNKVWKYFWKWEKKMKGYLNAANMFVFMKKVNTKKFLFKKEMFICMTWRGLFYKRDTKNTEFLHETKNFYK
jgi:hypothetical protein